MDYRAANGLPPIELTAALTTTAGYHTHDTLCNIWDANLSLPPGANLHSSSDAPYFADHSQPEVMWFAPDRYGIDYPSAVYEISAAGYASIDLALVGWQGSPGHNNVILNLDAWPDVEFLPIGIGVAHDPTVSTYRGNIYHVWFVASVDPAGPPQINGTAGDDALIGGDGADRLAFATGNGSDTISDVESGVDEVALDGTGLEFDDLVFTDTAGGVEVSYGTDSMVFTGLTSSDLGAGDFVFV